MPTAQLTGEFAETSAALPAKLMHSNNWSHLSAPDNSLVPVQCCRVQRGLRCPGIQSTWDSLHSRGRWEAELPLPPRKEAVSLSTLVFLFLMLINYYLLVWDMLSWRQEGAGARPDFFNAWNTLGIVFGMLRFDAVGAAEIGGQPSERAKCPRSWLWWCQGPASTMSDHLRTSRAPLIPSPHPVRAAPAAVRSPANLQKYVAWARGTSAFITSRPQSMRVWYVLSISADSSVSS